MRTLLYLQGFAAVIKVWVYSALVREVVPNLPARLVGFTAWGVLLVLAAVVSVVLPVAQAWRLYARQSGWSAMRHTSWGVAVLDVPLGLIGLAMWGTLFGAFLVWVPPFYLFVVAQVVATHLVLRRPDVFAATYW